MNKKLFLERVLGAILVSAFGFILYSAFLDADGDVYLDRSTQIPTQPRYIEPLNIEERDVSIPAPVKSHRELFIPTEEVTPEQALEAPIVEAGTPSAWVIQVGSFSSLEKADQIRDQLIQDDYKSYHRQLQTEAGSDLYRVLVGPYLNAEEAVRHQREVDEKLALSTLLMKFEP